MLELVSIVVEDYDPAIAWFRDVLGFALIEDSPSTTNAEYGRESPADQRPKRWVVVRPPGAQTGLLLAKADGDTQRAAIGNQFGGRVGLFLRVADFEATVRRMRDAGVTFHTEPRDEAYGRVVVFEDIAGNRWDLLG